MKTLTLQLLPEKYTVWQLPPNASLPVLGHSSLWSLTRTEDELSVVSCADDAPPDALQETGWRCIKVKGPLAFELTGVLSSLATPLAEAGVSVFALSTFNTDYLLVKSDQLALACRTLQKAGCGFTDQSLSFNNR